LSAAPESAGALDRALAGADELLFLCSGNIIRSAFAELYARHLGCPLPARSAGTRYRNTGGLYAHTARRLADRGVGRSEVEGFVSTHLDELEPTPGAGTLALGMTEEHLWALENGPVPHGMRFLLTEVEGERVEIADPMFEGGFARTFEWIERLVETLVERTRAVGADR
jgi:protein-tyrosine-phosphatase